MPSSRPRPHRIHNRTFIVPSGCWLDFDFKQGTKFGITNEAVIGALCIPSGIGSLSASRYPSKHTHLVESLQILVGAPLAGAISDRVLKQWRAKRGDVWVPEDRLRVAVIGAGVFIPCSVLCSGLVTEYMPTKFGLVLVCICMFFNGLGVRDLHTCG